MKLLFAEDEIAMAEAVADILTYHNYYVDTVDNGLDALAYALAEHYDGIILDIMMPGKDGLTVLKELRQQGVNTPVLLLTAKSEGGHASHPPPHSAVGVLSKAVVACEKHQFKAEITTPVREMLNTVGPYAPFGLRVVFANLWCFRPALDLICKKSGGELNALVRTTCVTCFPPLRRQRPV